VQRFCYSVNPSIRVSSRLFASSANGGIAVASFPIETYVNTNGITWNRTLKPTLRDVGWLDTPELEREELHKDSSAVVDFIEAPYAHVSDKQAASRRKVNAFYRAHGSQLGDPKSVWTTKFFPQPTSVTLEDFVEERMKMFFLYVPAGTISSITLHPSVLANITKTGSFTNAMYFNKKHAYVYGEDSGHAHFGQMSLFIRTAGGIWDISWHGLASLLKKRKDLFVTGVRQVSLSPTTTKMSGKQSTTTAPATFTPDL